MNDFPDGLVLQIEAGPHQFAVFGRVRGEAIVYYLLFWCDPVAHLEIHSYLKMELICFLLSNLEVSRSDISNLLVKTLQISL